MPKERQQTFLTPLNFHTLEHAKKNSKNSESVSEINQCYQKLYYFQIKLERHRVNANKVVAIGSAKVVPVALAPVVGTSLGIVTNPPGTVVVGVGVVVTSVVDVSGTNVVTSVVVTAPPTTVVAPGSVVSANVVGTGVVVAVAEVIVVVVIRVDKSGKGPTYSSQSSK